MSSTANSRSPDHEFVSPKVGHPSIDSEHEALFRKLLYLRKTSQATDDIERFYDAFGILANQLIAHFVNEEAIFKCLGMPETDVQSHLCAHREIVEQCVELNLGLMQGRGFRREDLLVRVQEWILNHLIHYDMKIQPFISRKQKNEEL